MFPNPALELLEAARDEAVRDVDTHRWNRDQAAERLTQAEARRDALQAAIDTLAPPAPAPAEPAGDEAV